MLALPHLFCILVWISLCEYPIMGLFQLPLYLCSHHCAWWNFMSEHHNLIQDHSSACFCSFHHVFSGPVQLSSHFFLIYSFPSFTPRYHTRWVILYKSSVQLNFWHEGAVLPFQIQKNNQVAHIPISQTLESIPAGGGCSDGQWNLNL